MLDELVLGGEVQETSKNVILKAIAQQDLVQEVRFFESLVFEVKINDEDISFTINVADS